MTPITHASEPMTPNQENQTNLNPRAHLGSLLKEARLAKNIELAEVVKATCIRQSIIESLEQGDFDKIGVETYVKGFIRTYADFLSLDTAPLLALYAQSPMTEKYVHPFDMAFPSPTSMAPNKKLIITCALALTLLFISFSLYDQHLRSQQGNSDFDLTKFTNYIEEKSVPNSEITPITQTLTPFGEEESVLKQVSKQYRIFAGSENVILDPVQEGWIELYQGENLTLRTKIDADHRYFFQKEPNQALVVKNGDWVKASYKGQPVPLSKSATCTDHYCEFPE